MSNYGARRAENIARNAVLMDELDLEQLGSKFDPSLSKKTKPPPAKRRKIETKLNLEPTRASARIASRPRKSLVENDDEITRTRNRKLPLATTTRNSTTFTSRPKAKLNSIASSLPQDIRSAWTDWKPTAESPSRDEHGTFHFTSNPDFLPNKSPKELLHEGVFGGSYFRPITSQYLNNMVVDDDWLEVPQEWLESLDVSKFLTSPTYDPSRNKYGVSCGQSIEEWEANGWINHRYDVRGWFQWYLRYFQGRRCDDDDRQISRWKRCVGETGRWRRALLKKYRIAGIRTVNDEGFEDVEDISPAIHQTCLHWAWEIQQIDLDNLWKE